MNYSRELMTDARVLVHATFTVSTPMQLFVIAVEVLEGTLSPNTFLRVPLNPTLYVIVEIASVENISNSWGLPLRGLCIQCKDESSRQLIDTLNIGDEILIVSKREED